MNDLQLVCRRCHKVVDSEIYNIWPGTPSDVKTAVIGPCCISHGDNLTVTNANNELELMADDVDSMEELFDRLEAASTDDAVVDNIKYYHKQIRERLQEARNDLSVIILANEE